VIKTPFLRLVQQAGNHPGIHPKRALKILASKCIDKT